MRAINPIFAAANEAVGGQYEETLRNIAECVENLKESKDHPYGDYFISLGNFLQVVEAQKKKLEHDAYFTDESFESLKADNEALFEDVLDSNYDTSYVNPAYSVACYGKEMGQVLSATAYMFRNAVAYAYENRLADLHDLHELYLNLWAAMSEEDGVASKVVEVVKAQVLKDVEAKHERSFIRQFLPEFDTYSHIVDSYDLTDFRYLFRYGMYIGDNEIGSAKFIQTLPEDKIKLIADTYTEAFVRGFKRNGVPLDHKRSALVTYHLGFERIVRKSYENLAELNLKPCVFYHIRGVQRPRLINTRPNKQMEYDHRFSDQVFFDQTYADAVLEAHKNIVKRHADALDLWAGPALYEIFGEAPFKPANKAENMVYSDEISAIKTKFNSDMGAVTNQYLGRDKYSFTINDYPLPSIGPDYEAIFMDTIAVNTLDEAMYESIQTTMIDALDQAVYVEIKGLDDNQTDLKVALWDLDNPEKETKFDNCTADVNVPVGEVYTSPKLEGTNGLLHVKEVYLTGLRYENLKIWFEDGMIVAYDCSNFDTEEENKNFVRETLIHPHKTLPLGEFAIGTNTVAYMMAKKYNIQALLPILIGEKTGPHFAIGDTCFTWSEDNPVYNSNGKEMIARENEKTCLRKTNVSEAYTYRHTDITIPYNELDTIIGYGADGSAYEIIRGGRFVLEGTQELNEPFETMA